MNYFIENDRNINLDNVISFEKTDINEERFINFRISTGIIQWQFETEALRDICYLNLLNFVNP